MIFLLIPPTIVGEHKKPSKPAILVMPVPKHVSLFSDHQPLSRLPDTAVVPAEKRRKSTRKSKSDRTPVENSESSVSRETSAPSNLQNFRTGTVTPSDGSLLSSVISLVLSRGS